MDTANPLPAAKTPVNNKIPDPVQGAQLPPNQSVSNAGLFPSTKSPELSKEPALSVKKPLQINGLPVDTSKIPFWEETQTLIVDLEKAFSSKVIMFYVQRYSALTEDEIVELYNHLEKIKYQEHLVLVLYGPGGSGIAAYRIVKLLRKFAKKITIVIPDLAASAMTMLALGGDEICIGPLSVLSPIDSSIANHPLAPQDVSKRPVTVEITQVKKYLELVKEQDYEKSDDFRKTPYFELSEKVHPIFLGTIQRSLSLSKLLMKGIAATHIADTTVIDNIVNKLNDDYPIHSYPILKEDLEKLGVAVKDMTMEQNMICMDLLSYYQALGKQIQTVNNGVRTTMRRYTFMESVGFRSYDLYQFEDKLVDKTWIQVTSSDKYQHAVIVKNKKGYFEVNLLNVKQFREWMQGKEVEI
jgi:hypothetical protein